MVIRALGFNLANQINKLVIIIPIYSLKILDFMIQASFK